MKKLLGIIVALILVAACTTALATGTYAVGTEKQELSGSDAARIIEFLKKNAEPEKSSGIKENAVSESRANAGGQVIADASVKPPEKVYATSVNNRVSLSWTDDNNVDIWCVCEEIDGQLSGIKDAYAAYSTITNVKDGKHTYAVLSVRYDESTGYYHMGTTVTKVTLSVLNGSDKPGAGADIREINFTGTKDQGMTITVYDNTYLHIKTDTLTWFTDTTNQAIVTPESANSYWFTSLGNDLYIKATKHTPVLGIYTLNYEKKIQDGKTYYSKNGLRAMLIIKMNYVKGNAPVVSKGIVYKLDTKKGTATVTGVSNANISKVTIPDKVKVSGKTYKVIKIDANAFKGLKKLKTVTIGKNVKEIGKNAFNGCKNLKTITIKSTLLTKSSVKSNAFKGIAAKATVKCPKNKLKAYKKFLPGKGVPKTAKIK